MYSIWPIQYVFSTDADSMPNMRCGYGEKHMEIVWEDFTNTVYVCFSIAKWHYQPDRFPCVVQTITPLTLIHPAEWFCAASSLAEWYIVPFQDFVLRPFLRSVKQAYIDSKIRFRGFRYFSLTTLASGYIVGTIIKGIQLPWYPIPTVFIWKTWK